MGHDLTLKSAEAIGLIQSCSVGRRLKTTAYCRSVEASKIATSDAVPSSAPLCHHVWPLEFWAIFQPIPYHASADDDTGEAGCAVIERIDAWLRIGFPFRPLTALRKRTRSSGEATQAPRESMASRKKAP